jgi:hypothetical protein
VPNNKVFGSDENRYMSNEYNTFKTGKQSIKGFFRLPLDQCFMINLSFQLRKCAFKLILYSRFFY